MDFSDVTPKIEISYESSCSFDIGIQQLRNHWSWWGGGVCMDFSGCGSTFPTILSVFILKEACILYSLMPLEAGVPQGSILAEFEIVLGLSWILKCLPMSAIHNIFQIATNGVIY